MTKIMPWKKATKYQNVNNPDTIAAEQYLEKLSDGHLNEPRKGLISPKEIKWTKCEWRNVKGMILVSVKIFTRKITLCGHSWRFCVPKE